MRKLAAILALIAINSLAISQNNWNWHQKHYFADSSVNEAGVWMNGHYELLSNHLTNEVVNQVIF